MRPTTPKTILAFAASLLAATLGAKEPALAVPAETIRALIVDGQNNHNWKKTTPVLREILEDAGIFEVDVATTPKNLAEFRPEFSKYDVVVSNYNGAEWPEATKAAFVEFVRSGGGLVSVHAADNSFPHWKEYNEMIGVGGWGGRDEKSGPMLYWKDGKIVRDDSKGSGGSHGRQHAFQIIVRKPDHPITAGLPEKWVHAQDELYSNLRGPARHVTVLATAYAAPETGGTGRHEPMLMAIDYGKGRVFHTTLGHHVGAMRCAGFAFTLQRGTEWAATGQVTLKDVPAGFPTADEVRTWTSSTAFGRIREYDFGDDRRELAALEESLRGAPRSKLRRAERELIAALDDPNTKYAGKQFVVRVLGRIGGARSVEPLSTLLTDPKLSHNARLALQGLPAPEATAALRDALRLCKGDLLIGVIGSLAERGDRSVVPDIAKYLGADDPKLAGAAIRALGRLGGAEAARALANARVPESLERWRDNARLACAESLLADGDSAAAAAIYRPLAEDTKRGPIVRLAAYRGLFLARKEGAVPVILALLDADDATLRQGATGLLASVPDREVTVALAAALAGASPPRQLDIIDALVERGDRAAYAAIEKAIGSDDRRVRLAAVRASGALGGATTVRVLAPLARDGGEVGRAAVASLTALRGEGVTPAIVKLVDDEDRAVRATAISVVRARNESEAVPALLEAVRDDDERVRAAAFDALGALAGEADLPKLTALLARTGGADRERIAVSVRRVAERAEDRDRAAGVVVGALSGADRDVKVLLIDVLPTLSTDAALRAAREALSSSERAVSNAALRALASWGTPAPLDDLIAVVERDRSKLRAVALDGALRLLATPGNRPAVDSVQRLERLLGIVEAADQKKKIVAALAGFPCKEALALAERLASDETVGETAEKVAGTIRSVLIANSLVATASHGGGDTRKAFDDNPRTRWSTNTPMRPGMWFAVDLGAEQSIKRIILDTRDSPGDYPRGSEVYVSFDGKSWGKPVLTSPPQRPITRLELPEPVRGRFVKIVQTGQTQGLYWSIHEMKIVFEE